MPPACPRILALSTAVPAFAPTQSEIFDKFYRQLVGSGTTLEKTFLNVGVKTRHVFHDPSQSDQSSTTIADRMQIWKRGTMELGREAVSAVLSKAERSEIGSFVTATSTGYDTPGPDILLSEEYGLSKNMRRTFIGHVGCHATFSAIKVGLDSLAARPKESALIFSAEISSAHFRNTDPSHTQIVTQALFGDACAVLVLGNSATACGPEILRTHTETIYDKSNYITWSINDDGFKLNLSSRLPPTIGNSIVGFVERLLAPIGMTAADIKHWGIHPGGPTIINVVAENLALTKEQSAVSIGVLADYGNCSATTILLILERILKCTQPKPGEYCVLLGFGPGISLEGLVLRF